MRGSVGVGGVLGPPLVLTVARCTGCRRERQCDTLAAGVRAGLLLRLQEAVKSTTQSLLCYQCRLEKGDFGQRGLIGHTAAARTQDATLRV